MLLTIFMEVICFTLSFFLTLFSESDYLSISDIDSTTDSQVPFIPSTEVLVKCLFLIAPYAVEHGSRSYSRVILCSHHPCVSSSASPAAVWKVRSCAIFFLHFILFWLLYSFDSEVAKKVETTTDLLRWLNIPQHFCYLQGNCNFVFL